MCALHFAPRKNFVGQAALAISAPKAWLPYRHAEDSSVLLSLPWLPFLATVSTETALNGGPRHAARSIERHHRWPRNVPGRTLDRLTSSVFIESTVSANLPANRSASSAVRMSGGIIMTVSGV